ncbi:MAG: multidrug transporter ATP-binding protein [Candidatus Saccharibacteria bacterium]|nr:multidrug transporter ATP-binding protein [Candidatus Saccharibacteria bacterium]
MRPDAPNQNKPAAGPPAGFRGGGPARGMMGGPVQKPKNFKKTLATIGRYLTPYKFKLIIVVIFAVISTVFMIVSPRILGNVTNDIVNGYVNGQTYDRVIASLPKGTTLPPGTTGEMILDHLPADQKAKIPAQQQQNLKSIDFSKGRPDIDYSAIMVLGLWLIGLYLISSLFSYLQGWIMTSITQNLVYRLRREISEKINHMTLAYFDHHPYGEVISRVTNDIDTIGQSLNQSATQIITSVVTLIGIIIMMLTISWELTLVALIVVPLSFGFTFFIVKRSQGYFVGQQRSLGELDGHVEEMFSGHIAMRTYSGEAQSIKTFSKSNQDLYNNGWKAQFMSGLMMPIMQFISNLGLVGVAVTGGWLAINGRIGIGDIQAFIQYMNQFTQPILQTAGVANVMQVTVAAAERVFEFLDESEEVPDNVTETLPMPVKGAVRFEDVNFSYVADKPIIQNFSATIKPGQNIAIVGPTGAGKTTIVNLLMRFYDIDSGKIEIDGVDSGKLSRAQVRQLFGMVLQDTWLFNGTIADNIAYGKKHATKDEIIAAAKSAHADHFIQTLPKGYDTVLGEETDNISAGEKQLLTIARAMLADAPMLILDEATSSVDTRTEVLIQKAMERLTQNRTSFVIAHRLSTIRKADLILVMKSGNIIEQGTHDQLIKADGFYSSLYSSQFTDADQPDS